MPLSAVRLRASPDGPASASPLPRLSEEGFLRIRPDAPHCGSPRTINLEDAAGLAIAHVDCDAFYAAVEKRDDPSLNDKPLIVGGSGPRGVVATCCYIARTFGVRSAMPMSRARALCPHAVVLPPDMAKYARVGREIRTRMMALTPLVEPLSIDEAFLDLTGCEAPTERARRKRLSASPAVEVEIGVTVSVGLSYCKFLAKLASDLNKPRGFACLSREEAKAWLAPQSVGRLWGVGRVGRERLERSGFRLIGDLQRIDEREASCASAKTVCVSGVWRRAATTVRSHAERETKSVSSETTFDRDISDKAELTRILLAQCDRVATRLRKEGLAACGVTLKLRLARLLSSHAQPRRDSEPRSSRRACSRRRARFSTPSPTASPIACWASPQRISRRPKARTKMTCSDRRQRPREISRGGDRDLTRPVRPRGGAAGPHLPAGAKRK